MRIACVQTKPRLGKVRENISKIAAFVRAADADILVFPELATSGYAFASRSDAAVCAEEAKSARSVKAVSAALKRSPASAAIFGFVEKSGNRIYNSAATIGADGLIGVYRKIHLFNREYEIFAPGNRPFKVYEVGGTRVGVMICFDWIYPESARTLALMGADVICHPANLVLPWCRKAMLTRSIENGVFTATANRIGSEGRGESALEFTGGSQITSPRGELLARASEDREEIIYAEIDAESARVKKLNEYNDLFAGRRTRFYL